MKTTIHFVLALAVSIVVIGTPNNARAQHDSKPNGVQSPFDRAVRYFEAKPDFDDYLRTIRPAPISIAQKTRLLSMIRQEDIVEPSVERRVKLDSLHPILAYHDRTNIEVKILRLGLAWAGFLEGAAVVISEAAIDVLTVEELQGVVAHELGHQYFAIEYAAARQDKQFDTVKEVELRCDAVAIITLKHLGLNPRSLTSGISKITKFNEARGVKNNPDMGTSLEERLKFSQAIIELSDKRQATRRARLIKAAL